MTRSFLKAATLSVALVVGLSFGLEAQYADDTEGLFSEPAMEPKTTDDIVIMEFSTAPDEPLETGNSGAQSVEELCCGMPAKERGLEGLCIDVICDDAAQE